MAFRHAIPSLISSWKQKLPTIPTNNLKSDNIHMTFHCYSHPNVPIYFTNNYKNVINHSCPYSGVGLANLLAKEGTGA